MAIERFEYQPVGAQIVSGPGTSGSQLVDELVQLGAARVLVVASEREVRRVVAPLEELGRIVASVFSEVREHVPQTAAEAARQAATDAEADTLLAVGGGSAVGTAKAVALTTGLRSSPCPRHAIPTTFSGSGVTAVWGLTDERGKRTGMDPRVPPCTVVYDPELAASLSADMAVVSAFNALAHGVEALWALWTLWTLGRNPASGISALATGLRTNDRAAKMRGGWLAASAIAVTGSGLHHKLCRVSCGTVGLPHAPTHAIVLPHVAAFTRSQMPGLPGASHTPPARSTPSTAGGSWPKWWARRWPCGRWGCATSRSGRSSR
ncbi:iron-containing alcohol dehydrogenase [Pseudonocardia sp. GCM10023141]|uniref:iron-containing alcohol dehydrogenase n=1 Tax=Pseudonocardia sp. GCM10023141 TaxID=3252653 RepID=UPI00361CDFC5